MTEYNHPDPIVQIKDVQEVARDLVVVPNNRVQLVPNVGVIGGRDSVLVVDTGMGLENGNRVLEFASEYARGRRLYLTSTHFHPEHAFGAQAFAGEATYLVNRSQADELAAKGPGYVHMFGTLGDPVARQLQGVELHAPDVVYDGSYDLDMGGRIVTLSPTGRGHTRGDQVVTADDGAILFTGDLVEQGQFAIFPWFPPHDADVSGIGWIEVMRGLIGGHPTRVVPGHNDLGGPELLEDTLDYLEMVREETWRRRDSGESEDAIVDEVRTVMLQRRPDWDGQEWIQGAVSCFCAEHDDAGSEAATSV